MTQTRTFMFGDKAKLNSSLLPYTALDAKPGPSVRTYVGSLQSTLTLRAHGKKPRQAWGLICMICSLAAKHQLTPIPIEVEVALCLDANNRVSDLRASVSPRYQMVVRDYERLRELAIQREIVKGVALPVVMLCADAVVDRGGWDDHPMDP